MPTLTTTEHGEIHVPHRQVTRMADRLWRFGSPARRTAYVEKARRRLAAGPPRRSDAAIVLAAGEASASDRAQRVFEASTEGRNETIARLRAHKKWRGYAAPVSTN